MRKTSPREDRRLRKLSEYCLCLPETERTICGDHADFRVRGKVFTYFLSNHHGDGIVSVCCKTALGVNVDRAARDPRRFYLPAYIGPRGWLGMRLDLGNIDWYEVQNLVELSYGLVAPRTLAKSVAQRAPGPSRASSG
jgi:predicted DNA-binding protein (MmcQ/YjbR family)